MSHLKEENLFPIGWYLNDDYHTKNLILAEAIQKHILVAQTELYQKNKNNW